MASGRSPREGHRGSPSGLVAPIRAAAGCRHCGDSCHQGESMTEKKKLGRPLTQKYATEEERLAARRRGSSMYTLKITVPGRPSMNQKRHWRVEARDRVQWRRDVCLLVPHSARPAAPIVHSRVHFDCFRAGQKPDRINLAHSCKPLLDALQPPSGASAGCSIILDDAEKYCEDSYAWHRAKRGEDRVEITVEEV